MDQDERDIVRQEIEGWLEEGAIDHETGNRLRERYRGPGPEAERATDQLMGFGAHLLACGVLMLVELYVRGLERQAIVQAVLAAGIGLWGLLTVRGQPGREGVGRSLVVTGALLAMVAAHSALWLHWITTLQFAVLLGMGLWLVAMIAGSRIVMAYSQLYLGYLVVVLVVRWFGHGELGHLLMGYFLLGLADLVASRLVKDAPDALYRRTSNIQQAAGMWYVLLAMYILARVGWYGDGQGLERIVASFGVVALSTFLLWIGIDRGRALLRATGFFFLVAEIFSRILELDATPVHQALLVLGLAAIFLVIGAAQEGRRRRRAAGSSRPT